MKFYYGNDYQEAVENEPVELATAAQLQQYQECYHVVIPANEMNTSLPLSVIVPAEDLSYNVGEDELTDVLSEWLSDNYGYCMSYFDYEIDDASGDVKIDNIEWDVV